MQLNWIQRTILIVAGSFMTLSTFGTIVDGYNSDRWLVTAQATLAFALWFMAATPRKARNVG